jgi:hypothetical protein
MIHVSLMIIDTVIRKGILLRDANSSVLSQLIVFGKFSKQR